MDDTREEGGAIINDSYATLAPQIGMNPWIFWKLHPALCLLRRGVFITFLFCFFAATGGRTLIQENYPILGWMAIVLGGLSAIPFALMLGLSLWLLSKISVIYRNDLLTPGVICSTHPLRFAVLANVNTGIGDTLYGLRQFQANEIPFTERQIGDRLPCVTTFQEGESLEHYETFDSVPIGWGTSRQKNINRCMNRLDREEFERLEKCRQLGLIPELGKIVFLQEDLSPAAPKTVQNDPDSE